MKQFFITVIFSDTGKEIIKNLLKVEMSRKHQISLAMELGFEKCFSEDNYFGGIKEVYFPDGRRPCKRTWRFIRKSRYLKKNGNDYAHIPRKSTKEGKNVQNKIDTLYKIPFRELNKCINSNIPFNDTYSIIRNDTHIGIIYDTKWDQNLPFDLTEITITKFKLLFPNFNEDVIDKKILC